MRLVLTVLWVLLSLSCSRTLTPIVFTPSYFTASNGSGPKKTTACMGVKVQVVDGLDSDKIGVRFNEDAPDKQVPIVTDRDSAEYVQSGLQQSLEQSGIIPASKMATLHAALTHLSLEEKIAFNAEYKAQIGMQATLQIPGRSQPCWTGLIRGDANNYGKSGSDMNYQETLNRALEDGVGGLLESPGFVEALCGKCSAGKVNTEARAPAPAPED